ncbi:hypothetical protein E2C01_012110 [Portunus trituberculatus]|uniref:Uncharacterized protein n=1 Tax=Portunus trituberculatus TaxID=210409 RepID=A0A5B7DD85_PORTR|nr:hypothetical protein [Portunus trituberculatus]
MCYCHSGTEHFEKSNLSMKEQRDARFRPIKGSEKTQRREPGAVGTYGLATYYIGMDTRPTI